MLLFGRTSPEFLIAVLIALGIGMTIHEFAHNYVGHLMGDPTPAQSGRLTLNPLVHINWMGWLMFALIGFGILGSAPISPYRMRNPRWGYLAAVAAGPLSNLLIAVVFAIPLRFMLDAGILRGNIIPTIFAQTVFFNALLFFFNLLPLFPIDGWHIVLTLLPPDLADTWMRHQQTSYYGFMLLLFGSFVGLPFFSLLIADPTRELFNFLVFRL